MTNQSTDDIVIPAEFAESLRRAATGLPGGPPELADVHRRRRHRQVRRSGAALVGIGVLVAASIVTPRLLTGSVTTVESATPAVTASPEPPQPAQDLLLNRAGSVIRVPAGSGGFSLPDRADPSLPNYGYPPGSSGVYVPGLAEVTLSGEIVPIDVPGDSPGFARLPDGRLANLEWQSLSDEPRRDGPCITDAATYLRVYERDGTMALSRDVRVRCENTTLVGASDTDVYLVRTPHDEENQQPIAGRRLVAHSLLDGTERTVADLDGIGADVGDADIAVEIDAGLVIALPAAPGCRITILDITDGADRSLTLTDLIAVCRFVTAVRLSPDGGRLAVAYTTNHHGDGQAYDVAFAVVDLAGPALLRNEVVQSVPALDPASEPITESVVTNGSGPWPSLAINPAGMAWNDDATVRVAWVRLPADLDRVVPVDEVLDVQTYRVP